MQIAKILAFSVFGLAAVSGAAIAQDAVAPGTESTVVTGTRIVCVRQDAPTGSHMGAKKTCHTDAEWKQIHANSDLYINTLQNRTNNNYESAAIAGGR